MDIEADDISHNQFLCVRQVDGLLNGKWNIVRHTHVFTVPHRKKGETDIDCSHSQGVVVRPSPHLHKVISAGKKVQKW